MGFVFCSALLCTLSSIPQRHAEAILKLVSDFSNKNIKSGTGTKIETASEKNGYILRKLQMPRRPPGIEKAGNKICILVLVLVKA